MTPTPYRADMAWLLVEPTDTGGYRVHDTRTGEIIPACCRAVVDQIAADRSAAAGAVGLGDVIHKITSFFGFRRCGNCAKRQVAANRAVPRIWRK